MREWHINLCVQWILRGRGRPPPSEWQVDLGVSWITARPKGRPLAMAVGGGATGPARQGRGGAQCNDRRAEGVQGWEWQKMIFILTKGG